MVYIDALGTITDEALNDFAHMCNHKGNALGFRMRWDDLNDKGKTRLRQYAAKGNADISDYDLDCMWLSIVASNNLDDLSIRFSAWHKVHPFMQDIQLSDDEFKSILDETIFSLYSQLYDL